MPRFARKFQHDVPVPPLGCGLGKNLDQRPIGLRQTSPTGAESKVGLGAMPIDSVTLSDGHGPGERALTRRYALPGVEQDGRPKRTGTLVMCGEGGAQPALQSRA